MAHHKIVRTIPRAEPETVQALGSLGVATVHEAMGRTGLLQPAIRPIQSGHRIGGSAVTVQCQSGDNMMIHAAVEVIEPGDVLVVTTTSRSTDGMFGELLATSLTSAGCLGIVLDAGVRDVAELNAMGFPVWSRAVHAQGTVKGTPGSVNVPIVCAGALIDPGDVIIADDDGVVVVPRAEADAALKSSQDRLAKEDVTRGRLANGELGLDIYDLRRRLLDLGVEFVDGH